MSWGSTGRSPLRADVPTLAEYLAAHGYDTAGFVANLDYCSRETGLARGFAHYEDYPDRACTRPSPATSAWATGSKSPTGPASWNRLLEKFSGRSSAT